MSRGSRRLESESFDMANRARRIFWALAAGNFLLCQGLYQAVPAARPLLVEENRVLEVCTALLLLAAALVGAVALVRFRRRGMQWIDAPIPVLAAFGFFDEMSDFLIQQGVYAPLELWGDPRYRIDAVHDLLALGFKLWRDFAPAELDLPLALALGGGIALAYLFRRVYMPAVMSAIRKHPALDFLRYAVILIGIALVLDLEFVEGKLLEELLEANGALALLFGSVFLHQPPPAESVSGATRYTRPVLFRQQEE